VGGHAVRPPEHELWDLRDPAGREIASDFPEHRGWLLERGAVGRLHAVVERLLADPGDTIRGRLAVS
jgi:hypothetical protein